MSTYSLQYNQSRYRYSVRSTSMRLVCTGIQVIIYAVLVDYTSTGTGTYNMSTVGYIGTWVQVRCIADSYRTGIKYMYRYRTGVHVRYEYKYE